MKIAIVTLIIRPEYRVTVEPGIKSKEAYCQRHGYILLINDGSGYYDGERDPTWYKPLVVRRILEDYDFVFFSDADVVITNQSIRLEDIIEPYKTFDMVIASDCGCGANAGHWFLRNTSWSLDMLHYWWNKTDFINAQFLEQAAWLDMWNKNEVDMRQHATIHPNQRAFNSFHKQPWVADEAVWQSGDFLIHCAGCRHLLNELMPHYAQQIIY